VHPIVKSIQANKGAAAAADALPVSHEDGTGWKTNWNGGCGAEAYAVYYPINDQALIETTVQSPYWFAACRAKAQVFVHTDVGIFPSAVHYATACAVTDPTCASTQTTVGEYWGQTPGLTAHVNQINETLVSLGLPPSYTAKQAVKKIEVTITNAD
jgi:hypothetical protein